MIYEKVTDYCKKHHMSLSAFERMCGIGGGVVRYWENDKVSPTLRTIEKIAKGTNTSIKKWVM